MCFWYCNHKASVVEPYQFYHKVLYFIEIYKQKYLVVIFYSYCTVMKMYNKLNKDSNPKTLGITDD